MSTLSVMGSLVMSLRELSHVYTAIWLTEKLLIMRVSRPIVMSWAWYRLSDEFDEIRKLVEVVHCRSPEPVHTTMNCDPSGWEITSLNWIGWLVTVFIADKVSTAVCEKKESDSENELEVHILPTANHTHRRENPAWRLCCSYSVYIKLPGIGNQ